MNDKQLFGDIPIEEMSPDQLKELCETIEKEKRQLELGKQSLDREKQLFEQKLEILKISYTQLASEKYALDKERIKFESEKKYYGERYDYSYETSNQARAVSMFFKGVTNILALKKRYKDLIKIFHPDNLCGDKETLQMINMEYESLQREFEQKMKQA